MYCSGVDIINLERRPDKFYTCVGGYIARGFFAGKLSRFIAADGSLYETPRDLCDAAIEDGFSEFKYFTDEWFEAAMNFLTARGDSAVNGVKGSIACIWSMKQLLRQISKVENDAEMRLFAVDNSYPTVSHDKFHHIVDNLPEGAEIVQCFYRDDGVLWDGAREHAVEGIPVSRGLAGMGDNALLLSNRGAARLLELWSLDWFACDLMEYFMQRLSFAQADGPMSGCYHPNKPMFYGGIQIHSITGDPDSERLAY